VLSAVSIKTVDCRNDGEFLTGSRIQREPYTNGDGGVHFFCAGFGVVMGNEVFAEWSIVESEINLLAR